MTGIWRDDADGIPSKRRYNLLHLSRIPPTRHIQLSNPPPHTPVSQRAIPILSMQSAPIDLSPQTNISGMHYIRGIPRRGLKGGKGTNHVGSHLSQRRQIVDRHVMEEALPKRTNPQHQSMVRAHTHTHERESDSERYREMGTVRSCAQIPEPIYFVRSRHASGGQYWGPWYPSNPSTSQGSQGGGEGWGLGVVSKGFVSPAACSCAMVREVCA